VRPLANGPQGPIVVAEHGVFSTVRPDRWAADRRSCGQCGGHGFVGPGGGPGAMAPTKRCDGASPRWTRGADGQPMVRKISVRQSG
jgi:hypothetical protein